MRIGELASEAQEWIRNGPVAIGGVGGSGTRVVAELVNRLGIAIGRDLNGASDNLLYTLLFKRPHWFRAHWHDADAIGAHIRILEKVLTGRERLSLADIRALVAAGREMSRHGHTREGANAGPRWSIVRIVRALLSQPRPDPCIGWGWKEPNTHLILDHLARCYPGLRYIHVMRHGFDLAFSENQQQVGIWAPLFDLVSEASSEAEAARSAYRYWVHANDRTLRIGEALGPERFLRLRLEEICAAPEAAVETIARFIGARLDPALRADLVALPRMPRSVGRYRKKDLSIFSEKDFCALARFGYSADDGKAGSVGHDCFPL